MMKTTLASIVVAFVIMVSLASSAFAQVSSGTISSKGPYVDADIYSTDPNGIYREIYVDASTTTDHHPGGPPAGSPFVFVIYFIEDTITGTFR
jgi:hypothetical protein